MIRLLTVAAAFLFSMAISCEALQEAWFPVGEQLHHKVYWGVIPVGRSVTTSKYFEKDGRKLIKIRIRTRTTGIFDRIRRVNDLVESIVDAETFRPVTFRRRMIRRKEICDEFTVFDYNTLQGKWENKCSGEVKEFTIAEDTQDILSFLYLMRKTDLPENSTNNYRVMADEGMFDLVVRTKEKEQISLPLYGDVESLRIDPVFDFDGLLVDGGRFRLWVSSDKRKVLTKVQIKRKLADIRVILQAVLGPGDDRWVDESFDVKHEFKLLDNSQIEEHLNSG
jgi:hypothetical protein